MIFRKRKVQSKEKLALNYSKVTCNSVALLLLFFFSLLPLLKPLNQSFQRPSLRCFFSFNFCCFFLCFFFTPHNFTINNPLTPPSPPQLHPHSTRKGSPLSCQSPLPPLSTHPSLPSMQFHVLSLKVPPTQNDCRYLRPIS